MILSENSIFFFLKNESVLNLKARKEVNIMKNKKMLLFAGVLAAFLMLAVPFAVASVDSEDVDAAESDPVAMIGDSPYNTIQDAITAAEAGDTIEILKNFSSSSIITIDKDLTIDGKDYTYTYTGTDRAIDSPKDNPINLTIKNLDIAFTQSCQRGINFNNSGILTLDNINVGNDSKVSYVLNLPGNSDGATVVINDSSFIGLIALNVWGENVTVTATDSDFICRDNSSVEGYAAISLNNDSVTAAERSTITINGGSVVVEDEVEGHPSPATRNGTSTGEIILNDTYVVGEQIQTVAVVKYGDNSYSFTTLQGAINHANENISNNHTIDLIRDIVVSDSLQVDGEINVVGHGKKITVSPGATLTISEDSSLQLTNVPVENEGMMVVDGNISSSGSAIEGNGIAVGDNVDGFPENMIKQESELTPGTSEIVSNSNGVVINGNGTVDNSLEVNLVDSDGNSVSVTFPNGGNFGQSSAVSIDLYEIPGVQDTVYEISFYGISNYGEVLIKLPIYGDGTPVVYHIDEDGNILETYDESEGTYSDSEYVYFYTDHNSLYMVSYINSSPGILPGMGTDTEGSSEGFSTADYATMAGIVIAVVMLVGLVCIVRRN